MKLLKNVLPAMAILISSYMFFFMKLNAVNWEYNDKFIDDFFTLLIFSGVILIGSWLDDKFGVSSKWKYKLITALCSFWMFISSIYHWIAKNEWDNVFIILSLINIVAFGLFFYIYAREFYNHMKIFKPTLYIVSVMFLFVSGITMMIFEYYYSAILCDISILLVISTVTQNQLRKEIKRYENK